MKGIFGYGKSALGTLALLGLTAAASAQAPDAREQRNAQTLERYAEVVVAQGRNEQCKVLDEARGKRFAEDVGKITMVLEKRLPAQQLLDVIINSAIATGAPESAAGCDEATRRLVEAGSEQARTWAEELRGGRSRGNSTQGK